MFHVDPSPDRTVSELRAQVAAAAERNELSALARESDVSRQTLQHFAAGRVASLTYERICRIAAALNGRSDG